MLQDIQENLIALFDAYDSIPSNFDYNKGNLAIEIDISSINDRTYKQELPLQVKIVGIRNKKIDIQNKAMDIDKQLNKYEYKEYRIIRENAWYNSYYDEEKFVSILSYIIIKY